MSLKNYASEIPCFNLIDPRLNALKQQQEKLKWAVPQGSSYTNRVQHKANSYSNSGVSFNFNTQGANTLIDRRFYAKIQWKVVITGVPIAGSFLYTPEVSAVRDFPLTHICENMSLTLNGSSVSMNYADALAAFKRYNTDMDLTQVDLTGCPTMLDKYSSYADGILSNRNSLATYQSSGHEYGRGSFMLDSITNNIVGNAINEHSVTILFTTVEPLFLSPLLYSSRHLDAGLLNVNNISVNMNFAGNLERVWSQHISPILAPFTTSSVVVSIGTGTTAVPELMIEYLNIPLVETQQIPKSVLYEYTRVETYSNNLSATLASGQSGTFVNNAIQLSSVPKKIYIYASTPRGSKTANDTDTFLTIDSLSLQYLNVAGQFSNMNKNDLFNLAVKNGVKMSFQEFSGKTSGKLQNEVVGLTGSCLCLDSTDLALPSNISSGVLVNSQLQFQIGLTNNSSFTQAVNLFVVVCNEGIFEIGEGTSTNNVGVISSEEVVRTRLEGEDVPKTHTKTGLNGSGLFDDFKSLVSNVSDAVSVGSDIYSSGKKAFDLGKKMMGKGMCEMTGNALVGDALVGGRRMTKQQLKSLLM